MDEIVLKYNVPAEEIIQKTQSMFNQIDNLSKISNEQQIRLLQETTDRMGNIIDSYVEKVKRSFDVMFNILKTGWDLSYSDTKEYMDRVADLKDKLFEKIQETNDKEVEQEKEKINEKLKANEKELEEIKKNTDKKIDEKKKEMNSMGFSGTEIYGTATNDMKSAMGPYQSAYLNQTISVFGTMIASIGDAISLSFGSMTKDLTKALSDTLGLMAALMKENDETKRSILTFASSRGMSYSGIYDEKYFTTAPTSIYNRLQDTEAKFAGMSEFEKASMLREMTQFSSSRQFGKSEDYLSDATNVNVLSRATNIDAGTLSQFFIDLRQRLHEPMETLYGRFEQLNEISLNLGISLKDVMRDYQQMVLANAKMGYSQEQLMGIYADFGQEIKKGTVTVSQLMEYMKGLKGQSSEQAISGLALLLDSSNDDIMKNYQGKNSGTARNALNILRSSFEQSPFDAAQIMRMMNNPNADYSQDPFLSGLMQQYGLTPSMLKQMNPEIEKLVQAKGFTFGEQSSNLGEGYFLQEKMRSLMGLGMPTDLVDAMLGQKGYKDAGTTVKVPGLAKAKSNAKQLIEKTEKDLESSVSYLSKTLKRFDQMLLSAQNSMEKVLKAGGSLGDALDVAGEEIRKSMHKMKVDLGVENKSMVDETAKVMSDHPILSYLMFGLPSLLMTTRGDNLNKQEQQQKQEHESALARYQKIDQKTNIEHRTALEIMMDPSAKKMFYITNKSNR